MPYITKRMLNDAVDTMPSTFETHGVIEELQRSEPQAYVRDLYRFVEHADPITSLHAEIGRRLLTVDSIRKIRKVPGPNIRGRKSYNQEWRKH